MALLMAYHPELISAVSPSPHRAESKCLFTPAVLLLFRCCEKHPAAASSCALSGETARRHSARSSCCHRPQTCSEVVGHHSHQQPPAAEALSTAERLRKGGTSRQVTKSQLTSSRGIVAGKGCGLVTRMCKLGYSRLPYTATVSK